MIGKIFKIGFYCCNPIGEIWHHNMWKLFTPIEEIYMLDEVHGEPYAIEVDKGYINPYGVTHIIHDEIRLLRRPSRFEIWQKLTVIG